LIFGDCLEKMGEIPDGSVDMVLADPPYGTTACKWDSVIPLGPMWEQLKRLIKPNGAIVMTASQPFTTVLAHSNIEMFKYCWVWDKHIPRGMQIAKFRPMQKHEDVLVFGQGKTAYFPIMTKRDKPVKVKNYGKSKSSPLAHNDGEYRVYTHKGPDSIIVGCWEANKGKVHPTQKPVTLMEYLIKTYTNEGETVLDFAMGSGTTGVACINTGRKFIGIELDSDYFEMAQKRIGEAIAQPPLFADKQ